MKHLFAAVALLISTTAFSATPFNNFLGEYEVTSGGCSDSYNPNEVPRLNSLSNIVISKTNNPSEVRIVLTAQYYNHDFTYAEFGNFNEKFLGDGVKSAGWIQEVASLGYLYKIIIEKSNNGYAFSLTDTFGQESKNTKCQFSLGKL